MPGNATLEDRDPGMMVPGLGGGFQRPHALSPFPGGGIRRDSASGNHAARAAPGHAEVTMRYRWQRERADRRGLDRFLNYRGSTGR